MSTATTRRSFGDRHSALLSVLLILGLFGAVYWVHFVWVPSQIDPNAPPPTAEQIERHRQIMEMWSIRHAYR